MHNTTTVKSTYAKQTSGGGLTSPILEAMNSPFFFQINSWPSDQISQICFFYGAMSVDLIVGSCALSDLPQGHLYGLVVPEMLLHFMTPLHCLYDLRGYQLLTAAPVPKLVKMSTRDLSLDSDLAQPSQLA